MCECNLAGILNFPRQIPFHGQKTNAQRAHQPTINRNLLQFCFQFFPDDHIHFFVIENSNLSTLISISIFFVSPNVYRYSLRNIRLTELPLIFNYSDPNHCYSIVGFMKGFKYFISVTSYAFIHSMLLSLHNFPYSSDSHLYDLLVHFILSSWVNRKYSLIFRLVLFNV